VTNEQITISLDILARELQIKGYYDAQTAVEDALALFEDALALFEDTLRETQGKLERQR